MNKLKTFGKLFTLPVLVCWFLMSLFVDIIAVPTVFRNVTSVEQAGKVGMTIFSALNRFEILFALIFILGSWKMFNKHGKKAIIVLSLILFVWSLSYNLFFTPQIIFYTKMIHSHAPNDPLMAEFQVQHSFYHHLYRYLDTAKLLMLLISLGLTIRYQIMEEK